MISAVIPTLNEARALPRTLAALRRVPEVSEVIVADGGSGDGTVAAAREAGCEVVPSSPGRGAQLRAGAAAAAGDTLWFVHADTLVPPDGGRLLTGVLETDPGAVAGAFRVRFNGRGRAASVCTRGARILQALGGIYGDAALFVRRSAYRAAGGFDDRPIFEDVDMVRRLRRLGSVHVVPREVVTSARRVERSGMPTTFARWGMLHLLYWLGVPPRSLVRWYAPESPGEN